MGGPIVDLIAIGAATISGSSLAAWWAATKARAEGMAVTASLWRDTLEAMRDELERSRSDVAALREDHAATRASLRELLDWIDSGATPPPPTIDRTGL